MSVPILDITLSQDIEVIHERFKNVQILPFNLKKKQSGHTECKFPSIVWRNRKYENLKRNGKSFLKGIFLYAQNLYAYFKKCKIHLQKYEYSKNFARGNYIMPKWVNHSSMLKVTKHQYLNTIFLHAVTTFDLHYLQKNPQNFRVDRSIFKKE